MVVPSRMGWAAPASVPGAMAAMSADSRRKKPAEPARLPEGSMKRMTGTGEASMSATISRVESSRPPGVPMEMRTAEAWRVGGGVEAALEVLGGDGLDGVVDGEFEDEGGCGLRGGGKGEGEEDEETTQQGRTPAVCGRELTIRQNGCGRRDSWVTSHAQTVKPSDMGRVPGSWVFAMERFGRGR
jgi:hypothetical protein